MSRGNRPLKVLERVTNNAYKIKIPGDFGVSPTLNVGNLKPYLKDVEELGSNLIKGGKDGVGSILSLI